LEHNRFDEYPLIAPQPLELAKKVQLAVTGSRVRYPLSSPKGGTKRDFVVFAGKIQLLSKNVCYKVSFYENFQRQSCNYIIPLSDGP